MKQVSDLTLSDFVLHPIWSWAEADDESLVEPVDYSGALSDDHDALFVACEFTLSDGTKVSGDLSVSMSDHRVYGLSFAKADGGLFGFPLQPELKGLVTREQLAARLGKPLDHIFPIIYSTSFVFSDGQPLKGKIE